VLGIFQEAASGTYLEGDAVVYAHGPKRYEFALDDFILVCGKKEYKYPRFWPR
jgi:hypothetical protein